VLCLNVVLLYRVQLHANHEVGPYIKELHLNKALVVTDKFLMKSGIAGKVTSQIDRWYKKYMCAHKNLPPKDSLLIPR
jgi:alcohol dehydrogenase class IV